MKMHGGGGYGEGSENDGFGGGVALSYHRNSRPRRNVAACIGQRNVKASSAGEEESWPSSQPKSYGRNHVWPGLNASRKYFGQLFSGHLRGRWGG